MADAVVEATPIMADKEQDAKPVNVTANGEEAIDNNHAQADANNENVKENGEAKKDDTMEDVKEEVEQEKANEDMNDDEEHSFEDRGGGDYWRPGGRSRGGRGGRYVKPKYTSGRNVKTDYKAQEVSSDAAEIRRQVEFYFSDSNLPQDEYLLRKTGGSDNNPVPLRAICNFKRMRKFQPFTAVLEAVKQSQFLDVDDNEEVTRKTPLDKKFSKSDIVENRRLMAPVSQARSAYCKGFGKETSTSVFDIEAFFQPWGVRSVRLRRHDNGEFKGSVFVEFDDEETLKNFLESEPKPSWAGVELIIMSKTEYMDMKREAIDNGSVKPREADSRSFGGHRNDRDRGNRDRGRGSRYSKGDKGGRRGGDRRDRNRDDKRSHHRRGDDEEDWRDRRDREKKEEKEERERNRRRPSPDSIDKLKKRKRSDDEDEVVPTRAEAEAKKVKTEEGAGEKDDTKGGAEDHAADVDAKPVVEGVTAEANTNGKEVVHAKPATEPNKKRARDEVSEGNEQHETKKVKAETVEVKATPIEEGDET